MLTGFVGREKCAHPTGSGSRERSSAREACIEDGLYVGVTGAVRQAENGKRRPRRIWPGPLRRKRCAPASHLQQHALLARFLGYQKSLHSKNRVGQLL